MRGRASLRSGPPVVAPAIALVTKMAVRLAAGLAAGLVTGLATGLVTGLATGLALALCIGSAVAGLSLEAAVQRDQPFISGRAWSGLDGIEVREGVTVAVGGAQVYAPQLIAGPFHGRGGLRWQSGPLEEGSAPPGARVRLGVAWREGTSRKFSLEGSSVSHAVGKLNAGEGWGEFYASVERRHWGPGWSGSLILDAAAPAVPAVGWRRTAVEVNNHPWASWVGAWGADIFVGRLQGHERPRRPFLIGMRLELAPLNGLQIGLSRTMQWGGRGRDQSASSLIDALLGNDNVGFGGITSENEPGNQLAGIDMRWLVDPVSRTSLYGQMVGEDEAGKFPSRNVILIGADTRVPIQRGALRVFVEWTDLLAGRISHDPRPFVTYRHPNFGQGYTQEGVLLGHPVGGDLKLGTLGWLYRGGVWAVMAATSVGSAEPTSHFFAPGRVLGAHASLQFERDARVQLGAAASVWHDRASRRSGWQMWLRWVP